MSLLSSRYTTAYSKHINSSPSYLTLEEVKTTARATATTLKNLGFHSCLVGSMACWAYGMTRVPNDIDIVVMTESKTPEEIKCLLVSADPRFYLVRSTNPYATYKVLWYATSATTTSTHTDIRSHSQSRSCKVDILMPGILQIPSIPIERVLYRRSLGRDMPLMPFFPLFLLKLQAWMDHRQATKMYLIRKQHVDVTDITELLEIAVKIKVTLKGQEQWLPSSFLDAAKGRVIQYTMLYPASADCWKRIGFDVYSSS